MSDKTVRRKRKKTEFSGAPVSFTTKGGALHAISLFFSHRWKLPSGIGTLMLMVYVFMYSSDFLILLNPLDALESLSFTSAGAGLDDVRSDAAEVFKANLGIGLDLFVLLYSLFFVKAIFKAVRGNVHLVFIVALLLLGMTYSVNPEQVLYSVIQVGVGLLIAVLYAIQVVDKERWDRKFCFTILFPLFLVHAYSFILFFANGLVMSDYILGGTTRFGGLPGNPNTAGGSAVIGIWACLYLLLSRVSGFWRNLVCVLSLCLFSFSIALSGSGTALTVAFAVVALLVWLRFLAVFRTMLMKTVYVVSGFLMMTLLVGFILLDNTTEQVAESFTSSLGKESDLTGRTELWDIALGAIAEKPLLGWSYDYHETVQTSRKHGLPFGLRHFHNGFLDTAVAGGLVLLLFMLWNMFKYSKSYFKLCKKHSHLYGFVSPLVLLVLLNLSEYSLLRPLNVIFQVYLCAYFLLSLSNWVDEEGDESGKVIARVSGPKKRVEGTERKRKSRGKKYRF